MEAGWGLLDDGSASRRYRRDSVEFSRVANLSDALFAIAMTLLVLRIEVPDVPADQLAGALADQLPQFIAFLLSFAVVANFWWIHHRFIAVLGVVEPGLIAINLVLLGAVALVPVAGLALLVLTWPAESVVAWRAPPEYRAWG
ncbi:DUF1211 domain-containing protein [Egibacter rhizosphaerae]|uniref:DUF1211 domain-containing protein n=1 Tax=Egibacter rhizosphaerae TaxID=1670831 RepID=A0A411YBQ3_9ACTN|nr:TMEM175 family protein [Egibacter rhizosphaerae]QBI18683.1 DUF1211 domain-containing protein [Egibacter rhizosphaerae]